MKDTKNLFLALVISIGGLFLFDCFSIIYTFLVNFDAVEENIMALVYLFMHLVVLAGAFYFAFKAFYTGKSSLIGVVMVDEHGETIKRSQIVSIVLSSIFFIVGIYFTLVLVTNIVPPQKFVTALKFALMNFGYSVGLVSLIFALYPVVYKRGK